MYYPLAQQEFESYLNGYDRENDRIKLKIIHTYGVVKQAEELAERMHLSTEDTDLARLIALLHDIGRFEQLKRYDSFEPGTMDHAAYGVKVLFDEGMIRHFLPDDNGTPSFTLQSPTTAIMNSLRSQIRRHFYTQS